MAVASSGRPRGLSAALLRSGSFVLSTGRRNIANVLTLIRLCCVPPIAVLTGRGDFTSAFGLFVLAGFTDLADGYIAKHFDGRTPLGAVLDPIADKLLMATVLITLAVIGQIPVWLLVLIVLRDLGIVLGTVILRWQIGAFEVRPSILGKISTLLQGLLGATVLAGLALAPWLLDFVWPLVWATALFVVASGIGYIRLALIEYARTRRTA
ncbi:MAG: CDP-alcohol phosphatidyltransferase family protein [Geminicoccaceae bacterium]